MTYKRATGFALLTGVSTWIGIALGRHATATSALPYAVGCGLAVGVVAFAAVAYLNGQPDRR